MKQLSGVDQFGNSLAFIWEWCRTVFHRKNLNSHFFLRDRQTTRFQSQMSFLCSSGFFTSVGRMIVHSFLHGGPAVYGISPAVNEYWFSNSIDAITIKDIPNLNHEKPLLRLARMVFVLGFMQRSKYKMWRKTYSKDQLLLSVNKLSSVHVKGQLPR